MRKTIRVYFRPEHRCSLKQQQDVANRFDGKIIAYVEKERREHDGFPTRKGWIQAMRKGEVFAVPFFHRLAVTAEDLRGVRADIRKKGAIILELDTMRRSDNADDLGDMIDEARDFWARRGLSTAEARALGKMGAAASPVTKAKSKERVPNQVAESILNDHETYKTLALALHAINAMKRPDGKGFKRKWNAAYVYAQVNKGKLNLKPRKPGPRIPD